MPFLLIRQDITKVHADAIVNPANTCLEQGSGTSRAIYLAAGEEKLQEACGKIGYCDLGKAVITEGFNLPAKYIIHAVGPMWTDENSKEYMTLYSAYTESLKLAKSYELESVAFPLLSSGNNGFPKREALKVAVSAINEFLLENDMLVYLVIYDKKSLEISHKLFASIEEYIDDHYIQEKNEGFSERVELSMKVDERRRSPFKWRRRKTKKDAVSKDETQPLTSTESPYFPQAVKNNAPNVNSTDFETEFLLLEDEVDEFFEKSSETSKANYKTKKESSSKLEQSSIWKSKREKKEGLEKLMEHSEETFTQMLLRLIDERGMTDAEAYKKANVDKRLFSKIRSNIYYTPSKKTIFCFAIALKLSIEETEELLKKAGYAFSNCFKFDVVISYFIENKKYDIFEINEVLFQYDLPVLGGM